MPPISCVCGSRVPQMPRICAMVPRLLVKMQIGRCGVNLLGQKRTFATEIFEVGVILEQISALPR